MAPIKKFLAVIAATTMTTFVSSAAMAHSTHDHSTVSYKWAVSKSLKAKINDRLK